MTNFVILVLKRIILGHLFGGISISLIFKRIICRNGEYQMFGDLMGDIEKFDRNGYERIVVRYSLCNKAYQVHKNKNCPLKRVSI